MRRSSSTWAHALGMKMKSPFFWTRASFGKLSKQLEPNTKPEMAPRSVSIASMLSLRILNAPMPVHDT